ncbi:hypothetical protein KC315_g20115, partial [Hortaea werneckii]
MTGVSQKAAGGGGEEEGKQDQDAVPVVEAKADVPELVQPTPQHSRRRSSAAAAVDQNPVRASPVVLATSTPDASPQPAEDVANTDAQALDGGEKSPAETLPQGAHEPNTQPQVDGSVEQTPEQQPPQPAPNDIDEPGSTDKVSLRENEPLTAAPPESPHPDATAEGTPHEEVSKDVDDEPAPSQPPIVDHQNDDDDQVPATPPPPPPQHATTDAVQDLPP